LAVDAVRIADEDVRASTRPAQRAVGDGEIVLHDVELRDPRLGEVRLPRVRDRDLAPADADDDPLAATHALRSAGTTSVSSVGRNASEFVTRQLASAFSRSLRARSVSTPAGTASRARTCNPVKRMTPPVRSTTPSAAHSRWRHGSFDALAIARNVRMKQ